MKAAKFTLFGRVTELCPSAALILTMLVLTVAAMTAAAQTTVFVPAKATGCFGNPVDECVPFVAAITVSEPGAITVSYVSGTVSDCCSVGIGPNGIQRDCSGVQVPLQEANGVAPGWCGNLYALIGVFVPQSRVNDSRGFQPIDGTKNLTRVGIRPNFLHFVGKGRTFNVKEAGTLFLGINDCLPSDNSGGFTVSVTGP